MRTRGGLQPQAGGECKIETTTRAALRALRTAGNLDLCTVYKFPVSQAGGGGMIHLRAVDKNVLPSNVHWEHPTLTAGTAWPTYYDIDADEMQMLEDPVLNNTVWGEPAVNAFPWGNASVIDNEIYDAVLNYTSGNFRNNEVRSKATVTVAGNVNRNYFAANSNTTISAGDFNDNEVASDATVVSSTTGDVDRNHFEHLSNTNISGGNFDGSVVQTDANVIQSGGNISYSTFGKSSNMNMIGGTFARNTIEEDATVTIRSGSNFDNYFGRSTVYNQVGTGYIRYSKIDGTTTWTNGNTNVSNVHATTATVNTTGSNGLIANSLIDRAIMTAMQNVPSLTIIDSRIGGYTTVSISNAARLYMSRGEFSSGARILISAGARIDMSYSKGTGYGYYQATQGILYANYCSVEQLGYIRNTSTGTNRADRSTAKNQANIRFDGASNGCRVYYSTSDSGSSIYHTGTSTNCYFYYVHANSLGQIYTQNSVNARFYYSNANSRGYLRSTNASATHYIYYCNASASGYIEKLNNTGITRFYGVKVSAQSIARIQNSTAGNIYYSSFTAYYYLLATLTAGTRSGLHGHGRRSYTVTNPPSGTFVQNF